MGGSSLEKFSCKVGNESKNKIKLFKGVQHQKEEVWDKLKNEIPCGIPNGIIKGLKRLFTFSIYSSTERITE